MPSHRRLVCKLNYFQSIILLFAAVILIGAALLMLPISAQGRTVTPFHEALFTATSAVCVTGLVVRDTASHWSAFGQAVLMVLIQIGGLGVITVGASSRFYQVGVFPCPSAGGCRSHVCSKSRRIVRLTAL